MANDSPRAIQSPPDSPRKCSGNDFHTDKLFCTPESQVSVNNISTRTDPLLPAPPTRLTTLSEKINRTPTSIQASHRGMFFSRLPTPRQREQGYTHQASRVLTFAKGLFRQPTQTGQHPLTSVSSQPTLAFAGRLSLGDFTAGYVFFGLPAPSLIIRWSLRSILLLVVVANHSTMLVFQDPRAFENTAPR